MTDSLVLLVYGYLNNVSPGIKISNKLLKMPIYNIPVINHEHQGPVRTISELSAPTMRALALNGYNHTKEGMIAIDLWVNEKQGRPENLLLFQPMFGSHVPTIFESGYEFKSIHTARPSWEFLLDVKKPEIRMLYLSAFDALNEMSDTSYSECKRREFDDVPPPSQVDVVFVHRVDASVIVNTSTLILNRKYQRAQSKVFSEQLLFHKVVSNTMVYIGNISSYACPIGTRSKMDFVRIIVVNTSAIQQ